MFCSSCSSNSESELELLVAPRFLLCSFLSSSLSLSPSAEVVSKAPQCGAPSQLAAAGKASTAHKQAHLSSLPGVFLKDLLPIHPVPEVPGPRSCKVSDQLVLRRCSCAPLAVLLRIHLAILRLLPTRTSKQGYCRRLRGRQCLAFTHKDTGEVVRASCDPTKLSR